MSDIRDIDKIDSNNFKVWKPSETSYKFGYTKNGEYCKIYPDGKYEIINTLKSVNIKNHPCINVAIKKKIKVLKNQSLLSIAKTRFKTIASVSKWYQFYRFIPIIGKIIYACEFKLRLQSGKIGDADVHRVFEELGLKIPTDSLKTYIEYQDIYPEWFNGKRMTELDLEN